MQERFLSVLTATRQCLTKYNPHSTSQRLLEGHCGLKAGFTLVELAWQPLRWTWFTSNFRNQRKPLQVGTLFLKVLHDQRKILIYI